MASSNQPFELATTPLTVWHAAQGARMVDFAGYSMPVQYTSIVGEHNATRQAAGLFDISHMGRLRFEGEKAAGLLDRLLTRRVDRVPVGGVRYSLICDDSGGILDDVLLSNLETPSGKQFYLLVVNASNRQKLVKWIRPRLAEFPEVACNDVTESTAMISIQGPESVGILQKLFSIDVGALKYYRARVTEQMSKPCILSRTGYTGEDGFELIVRAEDALRVWENLMLAGREAGLTAVGLGARDTLRLEAGMPLYGHELTESIDPLTAGLEFAVHLKDRTFAGSEALVSRQMGTPPVKRIGLKLSGRRAAREKSLILDAAGERIGEVTSGSFSPTLQYPIAMGYVVSEAATEGSEVQVDIRGTSTAAQIVPLPFYKRQ